MEGKWACFVFFFDSNWDGPLFRKSPSGAMAFTWYLKDFRGIAGNGRWSSKNFSAFVGDLELELRALSWFKDYDEVMIISSKGRACAFSLASDQTL